MGSIQSRDRNQQFGGMVGDLGIPGAGSFLAVLNNFASDVPPWSIFPMYRDRFLRGYFKREPIWSGAVYSMVSRVQSLNYVINGPESAKDYLKDIFREADFGGGVKQLIGKTIQDALTQDNGFVWEFVGPGNPESQLLGAVTQVNYLDPAQCWRTFDKDYPIIYINPITGSEHKLHWSRVHTGSNMTQPNELARGIGFSATSRLMQQLQLAVAMLQYRYEKVTGKQRRAILHGSGVNAKTLRNALSRVDALEDDDETASYESLPILTSVKGVDLNLLTLAGLPDNFDIMDETTLYVYICALVLGTDAREIWPSTSVGATKADATVQNMKARGKGIADLITMVENGFARIQRTIDPELMGEFDDVDDEADMQTKQVQSSRVITLHSLQADGVIDSQTVLAHVIHEGILNPDLVSNPNSIPGVDEVDARRGEMEDINENADPLLATPTAGDDPDEFGERAISGEESYRRTLNSVVRSLWKGHLGLFDFVSTFDSAVTRGLTRAAQDGLKLAGLEVQDMTEEERAELRRIINREMQFIWPFGQRIASSQQESGGKLGPLLERTELWANRYAEVRALFLSLAGKNKKLKWVVSPKKQHCQDCLRMNNRVYRASIWTKYNIRPRSAQLACSGYRCGCDYVPTEDRVTPGRPPALVGSQGRKEEDHICLLNYEQLFQNYASTIVNIKLTYADASKMFRSKQDEIFKRQQEVGNVKLSLASLAQEVRMRSA